MHVVHTVPFYSPKIILISSHLCLGLSSGLLRFSDQNFVCISHLFHVSVHLILNLITLIIFGEVYKLTNLPTMQSSQTPSVYVLPLVRETQVSHPQNNR